MSQVPADTEPTLTSATTQVYVDGTRFFFFSFSHRAETGTLSSENASASRPSGMTTTTMRMHQRKATVRRSFLVSSSHM